MDNNILSMPIVPIRRSRIVISNSKTKRIGGHLPLKSTLEDSVKQAEKYNCKCVQIFLGSPQSYNCRTISDIDKEFTLNYCNSKDVSFYVHCPYTANLAGNKISESMGIVSKELDQIRGLPSSCVLHVGRLGTIETVAQNINQLREESKITRGISTRVPYTLLLETAAGQGTELGKSWEEMRHLFEGLDTTCIGLCVDTQHLFASGMCDFNSHESVVKLFDNSESIISKGISLIHMNDSKKDFGSRVDRHEILGKGFIWGKDQSSLRSLISIASEKKIDMISETEDVLSDINLMNSCCK